MLRVHRLYQFYPYRLRIDPLKFTIRQPIDTYELRPFKAKV